MGEKANLLVIWEIYDIGGNSCEKLIIHLIAKTQRRATTKERRTTGNILEESQHGIRERNSLSSQANQRKESTKKEQQKQNEARIKEI